MNRNVLFLAVSLLASTGAACAAPTDAPAADVAVTEDALATTNLAKAVRDEIEANETDNLTEVGRAGLKVGATVLKAAQQAFDNISADYANDGTTEAYRFGTGNKTAFVVYVNGGDEAGYAIRVFDKNGAPILDGDAPSTSEPIEWTTFGKPVSPSLANERMVLGDSVKAAYLANGTTGMTKIGRKDLAMSGAPMKKARAVYDELTENLGEAMAYRTKIGGEDAFVIEGTLDDTVSVFVYGESDVLVIEGFVNGPGDLRWQYHSLTERP